MNPREPDNASSLRPTPDELAGLYVLIEGHEDLTVRPGASPIVDDLSLAPPVLDDLAGSCYRFDEEGLRRPQAEDSSHRLWGLNELAGEYICIEAAEDLSVRSSDLPDPELHRNVEFAEQALVEYETNPTKRQSVVARIQAALIKATSPAA